eukprot:CAMPEP_0113498788 /NCGR_PEP_ID=MMETSP0014_2-20120614/31376_1 /TAXON_ID=2857 /ORGANISM="Nitzschia sp." /LENGTH=455 /DNA_ID=CAMNT_0000392869 /DNA_START=92 /DNA_END=1456 /DNA_ORIENTATION=+ /assembly_acc=CAM_ASM_000159
MSAPAGGGDNGGGGGRSVRFANDTKKADATTTNNKRKLTSLQDNDDDDNGGDHDYHGGFGGNLQNKKSKKKKYYQNEDELDDVDDWNEEEEMESGGGIGGGATAPGGITVASEKELIEAKRQRRAKKLGGLMDDFEEEEDGGDDDDGDDAADDGEEDNDDEDDIYGSNRKRRDERSLKSEGVKFEPFNMRDEQEDGEGYFDGDTYVFRRNPGGDDGEPDAWADALNDPEQQQQADGTTPSKSATLSKLASSEQENLDDLTKEELYGRIYSLISGTESVAKAIQRYGKIVKQEQDQKRKLKKNAGKSSLTDELAAGATASSAAKTSLDKVTGAANALLLQGDVDIYQTTSSDIRRKYPNVVATAAAASAAEKSSSSSKATSTVQWEYVGNENDQIQGPFTTQQMLSWIQAGYFVGAQRVKIRTIHEKEQQEEKESTEDDLLADLMDDDDDDDDDDP